MGFLQGTLGDEKDSPTQSQANYKSFRVLTLSEPRMLIGTERDHLIILFTDASSRYRRPRPNIPRSPGRYEGYTRQTNYIQSLKVLNV